MRVDKPIKVLGNFWIPGDEGTKYHGELSITDGGAATLNLSYDDKGFDSPVKDVQRIIGRVSDYGYVTLNDCEVLQTGFNNAGIARSEIWIGSVVCGVSLEEDEELTVSKISFSLEGFAKWIGVEGIKPTMKGVGKLSVDCSEMETVECSLSDEWVFKIDFPYTYQSTREDIAIRQHAFIHIESQEHSSLSDYISMVHNIARFFSFANGTICCIKDVSLYLDDIVRTDSKGKSYQVPMQYFYRSLPFLQKEEVEPEPLVYWMDIADSLPDYLDGWNRICREFKPALWLYFSCLSNRYANLDSNFLALMQGIENLVEFEPGSFGISDPEYEKLKSQLISNCPEDNVEWLSNILRYANKPSLRKKMKSLMAPFSELFGNNLQRMEMIELAKDTRDYLTHYGNDLADRTARRGELHRLKFRIEKIFQFKLLLVIGMSAENIIELAKRTPKILDGLALQKMD